MSKFSDRIRTVIWNLSRTPGHKLDEQYDPRVSTPIQEAIDLLKEMNAEQVILKATPEQIRNLEALMESGPGEYQCMLLEDYDKLHPEQTRAAYGIPEAPEPEDLPKPGKPVFGGRARINVPVEEEVYKPQAIPELKYQVQGAKPGTRILVGNQQEPESHQQEQQPREQRHCTAHTTYAPETAIPERTDHSPVETPEEVPHYPV